MDQGTVEALQFLHLVFQMLLDGVVFLLISSWARISVKVLLKLKFAVKPEVFASEGWLDLVLLSLGLLNKAREIV